MSVPEFGPEKVREARARTVVYAGLSLMVVLVCGPSRTSAQTATVDTSVPGLPGSKNSLLGPAPGAGGGSFGNLPGEGGILGGRPGVSTPKGIPTSAATPGAAAGPTELQMPVTSPQPQPITSTPAAPYGTLDIPSGEDDGPPDGLSLDRAIDITLERSLDLRSKFYEIPMARADILQASLRSNPVFYQDGQLLQYAGSSTRFSRAAPGGPSQFDGNVTYPLDVSHKRQARTLVAARAERVLEAQYQDAVRQRIDDVYGAFVTALAARQTVRYARQSVDGLAKLTDQTEKLAVKGSVSRGDLNRVKIQFQTTKLSMTDAEASYRKARLDLGSLMNLSVEEILKLELKGTISDVRASASAGFGIAEAGCGRAARHRFISTRRRASGGGCETGQSECVQRCLRPLATVHLSGQYAIRSQEPVLVGTRRYGSFADLQPKPGWYRAGKAERFAITASAR